MDPRLAVPQVLDALGEGGDGLPKELVAVAVRGNERADRLGGGRLAVLLELLGQEQRPVGLGGRVLGLGVGCYSTRVLQYSGGCYSRVLLELTRVLTRVLLVEGVTLTRVLTRVVACWARAAGTARPTRRSAALG